MMKSCQKTRYLDISPALSEKYPVWPSDVPLKKHEKLKLEKGHSVNLSALESTTHLGSHVNAPLITDPKGASVAELPLETFMGECQVIEVEVPKKGKIKPSDLNVEIKAQRILFKTNTALDASIFEEDYAALDPTLIDFLHERGVVLVGIDTPGIDLYTDCQFVLSQKSASKYKMAVLECLNLKDVEPGLYELIAPPLKLMGFEASPLRALLKKQIDDI